MKHSYFSRRLLSVFMAFALGLSVLLAKDFVVVIDAGHGGHDPGSLGSKAKEKNINLGVGFMGESAKILSPDKTVLMPAMDADCPMAHMATEEGIRKVREEYDDVAVVCYINSTAALKELSDVCVTSANAVKIVKALPNKNIFFIPDRNLAHFIAEQVPEIKVKLNCHAPACQKITARDCLQLNLRYCYMSFPQNFFQSRHCADFHLKDTVCR